MILGTSHSQSAEGDLNSEIHLVNEGFTQVKVAHTVKAYIGLGTMKSLEY